MRASTGAFSAAGIAVDAPRKIAWGRSEIGGDPILAVLTEQVSDAHLAGLRRDGVSTSSPASASSIRD